MTINEMDLCLNITAEPAVTTGKKNVKDDPIINTLKGLKGQKLKNKAVGSARSVNAAKPSIPGKQRVKQKSLAAIVARQIKNNTVNSSVKTLQKDAKPKSVSFNLEKNDAGKSADARSSSVKLSNAPAKELPSKSSLKPANVDSNEPEISFTKTTGASVGRTLLARKRNVSETTKKRSLSEVFSKKTTKDADTNLLPLTKEGKDVADVPIKKLKLDEPDKSHLSLKKTKIKSKGKEHVEKSEEKDRSNVDNKKSSHFVHKSTGKISSLFGHNPEVPNIGQRFVKPINEIVFTGTTFADLNIHPFMISNLEQNLQITKMTTVQQKAIPQIFSGKDVLIRSQTGSGKTLAYALPIVDLLQKIRPKISRNSGLQALVVVPTRELALQTYECFLKLVKSFTWIVPGYLTGGEKRKAEKARLRKGCNILVGTPGRLLDHIKHTAALRLNEVKYFVLDEADRMFDMGYEKDISGIVSALKNSTPDSNTGYDAMQMLRKNVKKVFTEDDIDQLENRDKTEENEQDVSETKEEDVKSESEEDEKPEYHSSSDNDSGSEEPYVRAKKLTKKKQSNSNQQSSSVVETKNVKNTENQKDSNSRKSQTILLSATLTQSVEKLAGLAMENPVFVDAAKENLESVGGDASEVNEDLVVPQSVVQTYIVTPPKLRMVTLSAYIAGKCQSSGQHKIVIFMATQDMVDYHTDILSSVLTKPVDDEDEDSDPLVDVEFFKLYGNMTQKERTDVFKTFREARGGVLLCTDVAARGLDMPKVDCVIQYTGPLSARDYVHRIGRTARAGSSGIATIFLTPPEIEFVRMLESRRIRIKQENMNDTLDKLMGPLSPHRSSQAAAIALQNEFEALVLEDKALREKAYKAYTSWARFYSSYPRDMREIFDRRDLHLGHYAKSFALRDPPQKIGQIGKTLRDNDTSKRQHNNRLSNQPTEEQPQKKSKVEDRRMGAGVLRNVRMLNTSEYGSGLEPLKKSKKS